MILSNNEKSILKILQNEKKSTAQELMKKTGLNIDGVKRSAYFLQQKGLVKLHVEKKERFVITEEGKNASFGILGNKINDYLNFEIKNIPQEIRQNLWLFLESGFAKIEAGKLKILKQTDSPLKEALDKISKTGSFNGIAEKIWKFLLAKGFVKRELQETATIEITQNGIEFNAKDDGNEIIELTSEVIKSKEWKKKNFKRFNLGSIESIENYKFGKIHPLTIATRKIKDVFTSLGFEEMQGNYIETGFWNFDALFQPQDHPSREMADTFYIKGKSDESIPKDLIRKVKRAHEKGWKCKWRLKEALKLVLRTHTTALSSRQLYKSKSGKFFAIGRVFRNESVDYKHLAEFHQVEGIVAHKKANFRNLLWILQEFYSRLGFKKIRFRPSYFPYTEPSLEIEVYFEERKEWIELGGAGIFRKEVVKPLGAEYPVLAFGLSLERPLMLMLGLNDIRTFYTNNSRWLESVPNSKLFGEVIE